MSLPIIQPIITKNLSHLISCPEMDQSGFMYVHKSTEVESMDTVENVSNITQNVQSSDSDGTSSSFEVISEAEGGNDQSRCVEQINYGPMTPVQQRCMEGERFSIVTRFQEKMQEAACAVMCSDSETSRMDIKEHPGIVGVKLKNFDVVKKYANMSIVKLRARNREELTSSRRDAKSERVGISRQKILDSKRFGTSVLDIVQSGRTDVVGLETEASNVNAIMQLCELHGVTSETISTHTHGSQTIVVSRENKFISLMDKLTYENR